MARSACVSSATYTSALTARQVPGFEWQRSACQLRQCLCRAVQGSGTPGRGRQFGGGNNSGSDRRPGVCLCWLQTCSSCASCALVPGRTRPTCLAPSSLGLPAAAGSLGLLQHPAVPVQALLPQQARSVRLWDLQHSSAAQYSSMAMHACANATDKLRLQVTGIAPRATTTTLPAVPSASSVALGAQLAPATQLATAVAWTPARVSALLLLLLMPTPHASAGNSVGVWKQQLTWPDPALDVAGTQPMQLKLTWQPGGR